MINTRSVRGNLPLLLDNPTLIRIVQSGTIALFAVRIVNGAPEGERHYLFDVEPGAALFGADSDVYLEQFALHQQETEAMWGIIAVAVEPAEVSEQSIDTLNLSDLRLHIADWIYKLANSPGLPKLPLAKLFPIDQIDQYVSLVAGQALQPSKEQVLWVQCQQGTAHWLGFDRVPLTPHTGRFPLTNGLWISASSTLQLTVQPLASIDTLAPLLEGLAQLHCYFLKSIEQITLQQSQAQSTQFQKRQQLNQQVAQETLKTLASLLKPQSDSSPAQGDELLMVAGAVGKVLGIPIAPPMEADDPSRMRDPLEAIARSSRLRLRRILLRDRWWQKDGGPIIAYTRQEKRPVALLPVAGDHYELYDPQSSTTGRHYSKVNAAIAAQLNPSAFIFYRPFPSTVLRAWDLVRFAFKGQLKNLLVLLGMGIASTLAGMLVPLATGVLIDMALPTGDRTSLIQIGVGLLFFALGTVSLNWVQALATMRLETQSEVMMQAAVWDRLLQLSPGFFRQYTVGDLESRVSGISQIRRALTGTTLRTMLTSFFALLNFGLMLFYSVPLALVAGAVAIGVIGFTATTSSLLLRQKRPLLEVRGEISGLVVKLIEAVPKLRSAGAEARAFATWGNKYTQQLHLELSTQLLQDSVAIFNTVMPGLAATLLFWMSVTLIGRSSTSEATSLSTGTFLGFSAAFGIFITGATSLSNTVTSVLEIVTLWKRSQPILAAEPEVNPEQADPGKLAGRVQVDRVTFRYREDGPLTLDQVSLTAEPGEFIALVGPSGSGKSTLFRLLLGFDVPIDGSIYYDGQDLAGLDVTAVRRQLGVVLQNSRINAGSIFDNISASALIAVSEAWTAAEMAGFADDVRAMPMGMHTFVSEGGSNLSGGQRQRLMIARALALNPQILLFDEATSALDNRTQAIVTQSLDKLGVTRIVIAHRLSTIRRADRIYVIQAGRVVQQGTFDELAQQPGLFTQLIARQMSEH
ncbi:NHLP bacteriocin export ABC transporter permease/ATPase subunit [Leptolyngbya sp. FACHB-711]|uniref:NHLP bacteriocin export ABC transporter permease/ATPase subunit n=1 Tax=unclassified Leptolyngbya TaxID=2650499 RepID=UPI0016888BBA|nr:NHLP bacteriocin export ABC transporter permease/ATPase subunit [Leptolyngbya sp. FACHB-711]MBD1852486.1 NHLP bacteriocin export ABC transporter permease/ATPase subunit [Cyanobacteria bacterium FACHB-502]MBD2023076.1 NHLP bacteriocin export ABC transporter permease/ATPase subunit [Leptolyngbya sp. FACHB-711]